MTSSNSASAPDGEGDRLDVGEVGCHRLQQRTHRGDHDPQRRPETAVIGVGQPAQHHQPRADGVDARREAFVRQRLPGREQRDRVAEDAAQFGGQVVGLPPGGGDDEQRPQPGQRAGGEHPGARRPDQGQIGGVWRWPVGELGERGDAQRQVD